MPEILITVRDKLPMIAGDVRSIVANNSDYTVRFIFDDLWDKGAKTVYFVRLNGFAYPPVTIEDDTVSIPIQRDVELRTILNVGIQQGDIKTSRECQITVFPSITDIIEEDAVQPEPGLWEDIIGRVEALEKNGGGSGGGVNFMPGNALELTEDGVLNVKTTDSAEADNTLPITSSGVNMIVGNIGAILDTI